MDPPVKLVIDAYPMVKPNWSQPVATFEATINPEEYDRDYSIKYTQKSALSENEPVKYFVYAAETLSFTLWFDGTVPIPGAPPPTKTSVDDDLNELVRTVFALSGGRTQIPNILILRWARLTFKCVAVSLRTTYVMFAPSGAPIRAKCVVSFRRYNSEEDLKELAGGSAVDQPRVVTVQAGDTLDGLCQTMYGSSDQQAEVARVNGLTGLRPPLEPGTQLTFPPARNLKKPGGAAARRP